MSHDIVKRLRLDAAGGYGNKPVITQAADRIEELQNELLDALMQGLRDLGRAQEAYDAMKEAEAENERLRDQLRRAQQALRGMGRE